MTDEAALVICKVFIILPNVTGKNETLAAGNLLRTPIRLKLSSVLEV